MDYSNPTLISLRRLGQLLGILRPALRLWRKISGYQYEDRFDNHIVAAVKGGTVVWDVGANVGFFTAKFAAAAGESGQVVAWDPSPGCVSVLREKFKDSPNITVIAKGLSDEPGEVKFSSNAALDPTGGIGLRGSHKDVVSVHVTTGDDFVSQNPDLLPSYVKIDVEGFELEVLQGMSRTLTNPKVKGVFVEVHFQQLADRGLTDAPTRIVSLLKENGFATAWTDPSHLIAERA